MASTPDYSWPPMEQRKLIGKPIKRVDGPQKASGRAKYASDLKPPGLLFAAYMGSPHAHARITKIDTGETEKTPGVKAVHIINPEGTEIQWQGMEVAAVAATTEEIAKDALRKIKVDYEVLPHFVKEEDLNGLGTHGKAGGEKVVGDPDKAFQDADAVSEGQYGIPVVTHCCLETHGAVVQWQGDQVHVFPSTQYISGTASGLAPNLKVPITNIHAHMDYIGGGFGSKFSPGKWAEVCAFLSQKAGGAPVKLFLDRPMDQLIAGNRPSAFGKIKLGGKKDGTVTAWQSQAWGSGGFAGGGTPPLPYVIDRIPNARLAFTGVSVNAGPSQAWRAPNNQQAAYLTCCALEDFAAKVGMDPVEVFDKNFAYAPDARVDTYRFQLRKAAELAEWSKLWHPRGKGAAGPVKRGLGLGHPMGAIKLDIGDNSLPNSGASGGSSTVGGVSSSTRKSTVNALAKLFETVAPSLGGDPDQLEAVGGRIQVKGSPAKSLTWAAACKKIPAGGKISEMGENVQRSPGGLNSQGAAGVQIADVSVDTETGVVRVNRYVAVQDCGLVVNPWLAQSQVYGGITMGISTALFEERVMDAQTGRMLNPDMEFYKMAGIDDVGDIIVHMDIRPENDKRGVIGLGEPCAIAICAAMGNAVANAIGVRVPNVPLTPDRVLAALEGRNA